MSRKWMVMVWISVLAVSLLTSAGCKPRKPELVPEEIIEEVTEVPPPPSDPVPPPVAPPTKDDLASAIEDKNIRAINDLLTGKGLIGDVYFDFNEYDLRPDARDRLAKNAEYMKTQPGLVFKIEGHCDDRGTNEYNLALGDRRANTAMSYISRLGVNTSGVTTISYGEENPVCTQQNEDCWWQNRRAHFRVVAVN